MKRLDRTLICSLGKAGWSDKDIAKAAGAAGTQQIRMILEKEGVRNKEPAYVDTGKILALWNAGRSVSWISDDMNLDPEIVKKVINGRWKS